MVAMDAQGAFDSVHPDALKRELLLLGVPPQVCSWAWDLCRGRTVTVRQGDVTLAAEDSIGLETGVPQGSPASPVLFGLLTAGVLRGATSFRRYGYADDICVRGKVAP